MGSCLGLLVWLAWGIAQGLLGFLLRDYLGEHLNASWHGCHDTPGCKTPEDFANIQCGRRGSVLEPEQRLHEVLSYGLGGRGCLLGFFARKRPVVTFLDGGCVYAVRLW